MRPFSLAVSLIALSTATPALADSVTRTPPPTAQDQIWLDPALPGSAEAKALQKAGYIREEYFQTGTAHVYRYNAVGEVEVEQRDVPYTTRLLVLRPKDAKKFSGTVHLNPFHPVMGNHNWATLANYALETGDAFVGVMVGADDNTRQAPPGPVPMMATKTASWFNPGRYAAINWPADEDGIRWDVFADTARLIRAGDGPLAGLNVTRVYSSGWSFTGSFQRTYINSGFHDAHRLPDGKPLIDGYLLGISSFSYLKGFVPINSRTPMPTITDPRRANRAIDVPVVELQAENEAITNLEPQTADRDAKPGAHRLYELAGVTHSSNRRRSDIGPRQIAARLGQPFTTRVDTCPYPETDIDTAAFAQAAHENIDRWSRHGTPMPRVTQRLQHVAGVQLRDANGNPTGGVRPAQLDVPLASYGPASAEAKCDQVRVSIGAGQIPMRRIPLSKTRLAQLYPGGKGEYVAKFDAAIDALVRQGWLRARDGAVQKREARVNAEESFK